MKKSIAGILIGSALLLPNNNSVEASNSKNNEEVQKVQYIECIGWDGKLVDFSNMKLNKDDFQLDWKKSFEKYLAEAITATSKSKEKPVNKPTTPKVEQAPEAKPVPEAKPAPEAKPVPETKPAPEATPAPATPAPTPEKPATPVEAAPNASVSAIEKEVLDLTNAERQKAGLAPLQTDSNLMNSARQKSTDMATNKYFSHTSPTHGSPFDQMKANGVSYKSAAENIAMGQRTAEEVVKGWMESPGHKENILTPDFTHIGIGYDENGNYWTQQFIKK